MTDAGPAQEGFDWATVPHGITVPFLDFRTADLGFASTALGRWIWCLADRWSARPDPAVVV